MDQLDHAMSLQVAVSGGDRYQSGGTALTSSNGGGTTRHRRPIEVQATGRSTSYPAGGIDHAVINTG
jgi:hypothetical protein